jgi:hypothetical protein
LEGRLGKRKEEGKMIGSQLEWGFITQNPLKMGELKNYIEVRFWRV